ncbi:endonuclease [bacterium]|nr:endonuclease [bacterium]
MRARTAASAFAAASLALAALAPAPARAQNVLLSELCDPRLNYLTDRFIEIANVGATPVDLTGWSIVAVGNGADIFTWNLSGTIAAGDALVAGDATTVEAFPVDFPDEAWSTANSTWNGKIGDGARLLGPGAVPVDVIVATGTAFENEDLTRNPDVLAPTVTYDPAQWSAIPVDYPWQGTPGTHATLPAPQGPLVSNAITDPAYPTAATAVHVFADVADTVGTLVSVECFWGTHPDSIDSVIPMSPFAGSTYRTDTPIPAQAQGATVHFEIHAANDVPASTTLGFLRYDIPWEVTVAAAQGMVASSPYDGQTIQTAGVATASFGNVFVIQSGAGTWNGIWARAIAPAGVAIGDSLTVRGRVTESDPFGFATTTLLDSAIVIGAMPGGTVPAAASLTTATLVDEAYEGVLAAVASAQCTDPNVSLGEWEITDGSGTGLVGDAADVIDPVLGTVYDVTGCVVTTGGAAKLEPRLPADVAFVSDAFPPQLVAATAPFDTVVVVTFSEDVDQGTAETPASYTVTGATVLAAARHALDHAQVTLTVTSLSTGMHTLTANDVEDLYGNPIAGGTIDFPFEPAPPGYYDSAEGLDGTSLRAALHAIIDAHTVVSYADTWLAFYTTDDRPDGFVWDTYSDVPGGTPPYLYTFGTDQGGVGGVEGTGYNREHSWPQSWFNGLSPMDSDLFQLYPTDNWVNNQRGSFPYGEVDSPAWTSLNGCRLGPCSYPGYNGTVFEPIDEYKGDFARTYFYMTTRYYTEDASWSSSDMTDHADLLPWAVNLLLDWHAQDPVSQKEVDRNGAIYALQGNRNPFIDRPEFAEAMLSDAVAVFPDGAAGDVARVRLEQNAPNPFAVRTLIAFSLPAPASARVSVYDVTGRLVTRLLDGPAGPGRTEVRWTGVDAAGAPVAPGVYFYRLDAAGRHETRRMVRLR